MLEQLKNRLVLLNQAIEQSLTAHQGLVARVDQVKEQSLGNHNALVGRKMEIEEMIKHFAPPENPPENPPLLENPPEQPEVQEDSMQKNLDAEHE